MSGSHSRDLRRELIVAIVSVLVGSILTIVLQPYANQFVEKSRKPVLAKDVRNTNLAGLTEEVRKQISFTTTRYTLEHVSGGVATGITVKIESDGALVSDDLLFDSTSESYVVSSIAPNIVHVDLAKIRPGGEVGFEVVKDPNLALTFEELADSGEIVDKKSVTSNSGMDFGIFLLIGFLVAFPCMVIFVVWYFAVKATAIIDRSKEDGGRGSDLIVLNAVACIVLYNIAVPPMNDFLRTSFPTLKISDMLYGFLLYMLIVNHKHVERLLRRENEG